MPPRPRRNDRRLQSPPCGHAPPLGAGKKGFGSLSSFSTAMKASVGSCTVPSVRIFFFALFLLLQQLLLSGDVAAVALGQHVFAHGLDGFPGDDLAADGRLDGDLEELAGMFSLSFSQIFRARP